MQQLYRDEMAIDARELKRSLLGLGAYALLFLGGVTTWLYLIDPDF